MLVLFLNMGVWGYKILSMGIERVIIELGKWSVLFIGCIVYYLLLCEWWYWWLGGWW